MFHLILHAHNIASTKQQNAKNHKTKSEKTPVKAVADLKTPAETGKTPAKAVVDNNQTEKSGQKTPGDKTPVKAVVDLKTPTEPEKTPVKAVVDNNQTEKSGKKTPGDKTPVKAVVDLKTPTEPEKTPVKAVVDPTTQEKNDLEKSDIPSDVSDIPSDVSDIPGDVQTPMAETPEKNDLENKEKEDKPLVKNMPEENLNVVSSADSRDGNTAQNNINAVNTYNQPNAKKIYAGNNEKQNPSELAFKSLRKVLNVFFNYDQKKKNIIRNEKINNINVISFQKPEVLQVGFLDLFFNFNVNHLINYGGNKYGFLLEQDSKKQAPVISGMVINKNYGAIKHIKFQTILSENRLIFDRDMIIELLAYLFMNHNIMYISYDKENKIITMFCLVKDIRDTKNPRNKILKIDFFKDRDFVSTNLFECSLNKIPKKDRFLFEQNLSILQNETAILDPFNSVEIVFTVIKNQVAIYFCVIQDLLLKEIYLYQN